ncbi:MAG: hypothetical protein OEZ01_05095 [Candidatus Heimdallarchaeota archaeon]|nr:hypothetical protein [Candidatus Heimdallarchaeota archaeon]
MSDIRQLRAYPFESMIVQKEDMVIIELGLDHATPIPTEFTIVSRNYYQIINAMKSIFMISMIPKKTITKNKYEYYKWFDEFILKQLQDRYNAANDKPDHMKSDIIQLSERRDALKSRINSQLKHYEKVKYQLDKTEELIVNYWEIKSGPLVTTMSDSVFFETVDHKNQIYMKLEISTKMFEYDESTKYGSSWMEYSTLLNEHLNQLILDETKEKFQLRLTTEIPKKDFRVLWRTDQISKRLFTVSENWLNSFYFTNILNLLSNSKIKLLQYQEIKFSRIELFDIVSQIIIYYQKKGKIKIKISVGSDLDFSTNMFEDELRINQKSTGLRHSFHFMFDTHVFYLIENLLFDVDHAKFRIFGNYLPNSLILDLNGMTLEISSASNLADLINPNISYLLKSQFEYIDTEILNLIDDVITRGITNIEEILNRIGGKDIKEGLLYLISTGNYLCDGTHIKKRYLFKEQLKEVTEEDIYIESLISNFQSNFSKIQHVDETICSVEFLDVLSKIIIKNKLLHSISCTCTTRNLMKYPCIHTRAHYAILLMEGVFIE